MAHREDEMSIERFYDKTISWKRFDGTLDGWGKPDYSAANWDEVFSVSGLLQPRGGDKKFINGKDTVYRTHTIFCENVAITENDRAYIGSDVYRISGKINPNDMGHHIEVDVVQVV
jgi:hypothetical protein